MVDNFSVKYGDPSCIGFWDIIQKNRHIDGQTNAHENLPTQLPSAWIIIQQMWPYRGQSKPASCSADNVLPPENCINDNAAALGHLWNKPKNDKSYNKASHEINALSYSVLTYMSVINSNLEQSRSTVKAVTPHQSEADWFLLISIHSHWHQKFHPAETAPTSQRNIHLTAGHIQALKW